MIAAIIEHDQGVLSEFSLQMLAYARQLAESTGAGITAVVIGEDAEGVVQDMKQYPVSRVVWVRHPQLQDYAPQAWAKGVVDLMEAHKPEMVLAAATDRGSEVMAHVGAMTDLPLAANCIEVKPGTPYQVTRLRWGGSLLEQAELKGDPRLITLGLHVFEPLEAGQAEEKEVQTLEPGLSDQEFRVRLTERQAIQTEGVTLKTAPVVVGGGRGVGSAEGYQVLEELAELLGGAVGGSRVATNNGWRSHADQVGSTGNRISPDLYIACGISGAIQHLVGCKGAKNILVINKDPEAPFFSKADYGVVGDLHQILPAIIEEARKSS
jgi:electron transfer flavoprotein alpha subunit